MTAFVISIIVVFSLSLGFFVGNLVMRNKNSLLKSDYNQLLIQKNVEKTQAEADIKNLQKELEKEKADAEVKIGKIKEELKEKLEEKQSDFDKMFDEQEKRHNQAIENQQKNFDSTMADIRTQMKEATDGLLKERQQEFANTSRDNISQIVNPLMDSLKEMKKTMDSGVLKQTELGSELRVQVENIARHSEAAQKSAEELTKAFKGESKTQGNWGEKVLQSLLESYGFTEGQEFETQKYLCDDKGDKVKDDEGTKKQPDVILHLDQRREVIIDSKVSLTAYIDYVNAKNEQEEKAYLKRHIESIRNHVKNLSEKDYSKYIIAPKVKLDFVIMFVPHADALAVVRREEPKLWSEALAKNVFIADEQILYATLRMIDFSWTQIKQADNHRKVFELADEIVKRVGMLTDRYNAIGKALNDAQEAYKAADLKIQPKGQSIIQKCNELLTLGAKQNDKYPLPQLIDIDDAKILEDTLKTTENDELAKTDK